MKKWLWVPILVILFFLFCCKNQDKAGQEKVVTESGSEGIASIAQKVESNLDLAVENLAQGQVGGGANLLLDSVLLVKPHDQWPVGFADNVSTAKEHFASGNFPDAVGCVSKALDLIKPPEDTEPSAESGEMASIAALMRGKISEAKVEFEKGNADKGVISILEALQLLAPKTQ
jgi:hypothetical protein